jgi:phospholipase C
MMHKYLLLLACALAFVGASSLPAAQDKAVPRYDHIFVIVEENKSATIINGPDAPSLTSLAKTYGTATNFYAETHPSEPNYVALVGGGTFGILDDDAYYCKQGDKRPYCNYSWVPGFANHTVRAPNIGTQLQAAGLTWKNYNESLPEPGSLAVVAADPKDPNGPRVYASKHSGFVNFADVQNSPIRTQELVDFNQLEADVHSNQLPNFALIIPNLCNDMHGIDNNSPDDCKGSNEAALIRRGDTHAKMLVDQLMSSKTWNSADRDAIVITFDEDDHHGKEGCCGIDRNDPANSGGGRIPTIVITNHGPRGVVDPTPYSHYSLLRTIEDAFGVKSYLLQASAPGVVPMVPLFEDKTGQ